tara:strand:+ start:2687 stop:3208 length:522 start_codon:yes stop_codon:yes gene_type:complete
MIISYAKGWAKTLDINGKTNRKEFWAFVIVDITIFVLLNVINQQVYGEASCLFCSRALWVFPPIYFLLGWVTRITLLTRRIKDSGRNSYWMFWYFVPLIGWAILTILALQPTTKINRDTFQVRVTENLNKENSYQKTNEPSLQVKLEELKTLKKEGLVSEEEYEKMRKNTLGL